MSSDLTIKLGDYEVIALDRENLLRPSLRLHLAFIRYNGMIPQGNQSVLALEIGSYDGTKHMQSGHPFYIPSTEKVINCRVDTSGRRVKLEISEASPLEIKAKDLTERQTAISD